MDAAAGAQDRRYLWDGDRIVARFSGLSGSAIAERYVFTPGSLGAPVTIYEGSGTATGDRRYVLTDERGSVIALTDGGTGAQLTANSYGPFGQPGTGNAGAFQYAGQLWLPEAGLTYMRNRVYSAELGRFLQTDPIGYQGGMNLYAYVLNDPVNATDPWGLREKVEIHVIAQTGGDIDLGPIGIYTSLVGLPTTFGGVFEDIGFLYPEIVVTAPRRSSRTVWGHNYQTLRRISDEPCNLSDEERRDLVQRHSTPFDPGAEAINGRVELYGRNPIEQRITNNGFTVVNQTLVGHQMHSNQGGGSVVRSVYVRGDGYLYSSTIGRGTNSSRFLAGLNQLTGPLIFGALDSAMADEVRDEQICQ